MGEWPALQCRAIFLKLRAIFFLLPEVQPCQKYAHISGFPKSPKSTQGQPVSLERRVSSSIVSYCAKQKIARRMAYLAWRLFTEAHPRETLRPKEVQIRPTEESVLFCFPKTLATPCEHAASIQIHMCLTCSGWYNVGMGRMVWTTHTRYRPLDPLLWKLEEAIASLGKTWASGALQLDSYAPSLSVSVSDTFLPQGEEGT